MEKCGGQGHEGMPRWEHGEGPMPLGKDMTDTGRQIVVNARGEKQVILSDNLTGRAACGYVVLQFNIRIPL